MPFLTSTAGGSQPEPLVRGILQQDESMPIAIVGMSCRFPGDATNPDKLWKLCADRQAAWSEIPKERMNIDAFYHPDAERAGNMNNRGGHFLKQDLGSFDAAFFSVSPTEAKSMDPQQRLLLECTYEALENGGMTIEDVAGSLTSCYVGNFSRDYYDMGSRDVETAPLHSSTGNASSILSNRLSYFYDLKGPSLTLDTACSSSLVALHLACQSLRTGESKQSVVGATNLILNPDVMVTMSKLHFLSPTSTCHTYDSRADGYARGEGITALILKPLEDAIRDNDTIRAVIRGSASNQDGKTSGITLPSPKAQEELIRTAYRDAGFDFSGTGYFEAHGTGTQAGDPLESGAIGATIGQVRPVDEKGDKVPLYVGSVKTNIGHTEGASGLAGVIKAVLALEHGVIPPNIHFEKPNPRIDLKGWNLRVPTESLPWPHAGQRRVSVNSFGFGGSNAHVILDDAYHYLTSRGLRAAHRTSIQPLLDATATVSNSNETPPAVQLNGNGLKANGTLNGHANGANGKLNGHANGVNGHTAAANLRYRVFLWSTHEESIVALNNTAFADHLAQRKIADEETFLDNLAYTQCTRRSKLPWRSFLIANSVSDLVAKMLTTHQKPVRAPTTAPRLGFVFTGQGAQWFAMGRELIKTYPLFQQRIEECDLFFTELGADWSLIDELNKSDEDSRINESLISQTACTALQIALVDLLASWGIRPQRVIGHSSGEMAAAYAAGILPAESALKAAYFRGVHSSSVKLIAANGAMMAVGLSETEARARIASLDPEVGQALVACVNSPSNVTVSGDRPALEALAHTLEKEGVFARFLKVRTAYHSHHMEAVAADYEQSLAGMEVNPVSDTVEMTSTVTGELVTASDILGPKYWRKNMVACVRFNDGLQNLCTRPSAGKRARRRAGNNAAVDVLVEVGPHAALGGPIKQILQVPSLQKSDIVYRSLLSRGRDACETTLETVAFLSASGYPVDLTKVNTPNSFVRPQVVVDLPSYAWNHRKRHWMESRLSLEHRFRRHGRSDFLGYPVSDWNPTEPRWRNLIRLREQPWLKGHAVQGSYLYPGMGYLCMAIEALQHLREMPEYTGPSGTLVGYRLKDVKISRALVIPSHEEEVVETLFSMRHSKESSATFSNVWYEWRVFSYSHANGWAEHAHGLISPVHESSVIPRENNFHYLPELEKVLSTDKFPGSKTVDKMYKMMADVGLAFQEPFRNMVGELKSFPGAAQGSVTVPDTKSLMPFNYEYPHLIHPATADAFGQMIFPAFLHGKNKCPAVYVPVSFDDVFISTDIAQGPGHRFKCATSAVPNGVRDLMTEIMVSDEATGELVATFQRMGCSRMEAALNDADEAKDAIHKLAFHSTWQPDPAILPRVVGDQMMCDSLVPPADPQRVSNLETVAYYYYDQALRRISEEQVPSMKPHFQQFYQYMQHRRDMVRSHQIAHQTPEWEQLDHPAVSARIEELIARLEPTGIDSQILCRVGRQLDQILIGEVDPLAVMLEDELLYQYYSQTIPTTTLYHYTSLLANKNPNMDILEIGGGTGGATESILEALGGNNGRYPKFNSYTFTDISSGFFEQAGNKFKDWQSLMEFRRLNIEEDPVDQGFAEQQYDLVVAASVLHATSNMDRTIANTRKLLKPGGRLILVEITNPLDQAFLLFGCLPGWWTSEESYRKWGPTMSEELWAEALQRNGFGDFSLAAPDNVNPQDEMGRVFSCLAVESSPDQAVPAATPSLVLITDEDASPSSNALSQAIEQRLAELAVPIRKVPLSCVAETSLTDAFCVSIAELDRAIIRDMKPSEFAALQHLRNSKGLLWVSEGASGTARRPDSALFHGLARTLRSENESFPLITADFAAIDRHAPGEASEQLLRLLQFILQNPEVHEDEYWFEGGSWQINRCIGYPDINRVIHDHIHDGVSGQEQKIEPQPFYQPGRPLKMKIKTPGLLDTLVFEDDELVAEPLGPGEAEIEVKASGVNFRDIMICTAQMADPNLGFDCAGVVKRIGSEVQHLKVGQRVTVWSKNTYANYVRSDAQVVQPIPDDMSFAVAASLPIVFATVVYSLQHVARLLPGESILIHAAAGGVGQAAIMLAQLIGADVFVTVGTPEKRDLVRREFNIPENRIFSSRDLDFARQIKELTGGHGVDVVLNSLAGEALSATWECIAPFGRFVEMGKKDILDNRRLDMAPFIRNVTFASIDLNMIRWDAPRLAGQLLKEAMDMLHAKKMRPIPCVTTFTYSQIEEAFRFMMAGKHVGKVVIVPHEDDIVPAHPRAIGPLTLAGDGSYLLAGFGGLGRSVARWMASRGAKNLILASRSGAKRPAVQQLVEELKQTGVRVEVLPVDVTDGHALQSQLQRVLQFMPPLRGIIQGAMVLDDQIFENMSLESFNRAVRPKVQGSWNLHEASKDQPLDFFILLSSAVGVLGNPGQANYGAGNSYQDALAEHLRALGRPATAIDLGLMGDIGAVAEEESGIKLRNLQRKGYVGVTEEELLTGLELVMQGSLEQFRSLLIAGINVRSSSDEDGADVSWMTSPIFSHLAKLDVLSSTTAKSQGAQSTQVLLKAAENLSDATEIILHAIRVKLSRNLMIDLAELDPTRPTSAFGIDSLIAVELRNWFQKDMKVEIPVFEILQAPSLQSLALRVAEKSGFTDGTAVEAQ
ncbi:MAG: hypothetical protein M1819_004728 [Sarea resinae]|nr:MAG: hypothetical protein M1819_004728 [Sarea resinae]